MSGAAYETGLAIYVLSRIANGWTKPTAKQRSTLELLQYMAIMGPTQVAAIKAGVFDPGRDPHPKSQRC